MSWCARSKSGPVHALDGFAPWAHGQWSLYANKATYWKEAAKHDPGASFHTVRATSCLASLYSFYVVWAACKPFSQLLSHWSALKPLGLVSKWDHFASYKLKAGQPVKKLDDHFINWWPVYKLVKFAIGLHPIHLSHRQGQTIAEPYTNTQ